MTLTTLGALCGIFAGALQALAYIDYNRLILERKLQPNGSTWFIWTVLAGLNSLSYYFTADDWAKIFLSVVNAGLCVGTFVLAFTGKRFDKMSGWDIVALFVGLSSTLVWYYYQSAMYGNFVLQLSIAIGFVPTYRMVWNHPEKERVRPWLLWTLAYAVLTLAVLFRWRGQWEDLVYPINCLLLHPVVAGLVFVRMKK